MGPRGLRHDCDDNLRVTFWNIGGAPTHLELLLWYASAHPCDILILNETKSRDGAFWAHVREMTGWSIINVARVLPLGPHGHAPRASGGVAIVCTAGNLAMSLITSDQRGLLGVEVRRKDGHADPVAVFTAYIPPAGSPFFADGAALYAQLTARVLAAQGVYGPASVVVAMDANARLGSGALPAPLRRHRLFSVDQTRTTAAGAPLLALLAAARLLPAHGRAADEPAHDTSRDITGGPGRSVVDLVLLPAGGTSAEQQHFTVAPPIPWEGLPVSCSHRPLAIVMQRPVAAASGLPPAAPPPPPAGPAWRREPYRHANWHRLAAALDAGLRARAAVAALAPNGAAPSATDAVATLNAVVTTAMNSAMAAAPTAAAAAGPRAPAPPLRGAAGAAAAQRRAREVGGVHDLRLPPPLLDLVRRSGAAWKAITPASSPLEIAAAQRLRAAARSGLWKLRAQIREAYVLKLQRLRPKDAKSFFLEVKQLAPADGHVANLVGAKNLVPAEAGCPPPLARLTAALVAEAGAAAPDPPAIQPGGEAWLDPALIPAAPAGAGDALARDVSAEEVANLLFPQRRGAPAACCPASGLVDGGCAVCADFNATRSAWRGAADLRNPTPRNSPTANTAAANPPGQWGLGDLRFARPEDPREIGPFRARVAGELAAAMTKCLREGMPPADLLLSHAVSLAKPARAGGEPPNHADPAFRRFIVMAPALSKLLELVLAARVSHFAVRYGLVDVGVQGAFVPLAHSGAHAFALLELLRLRARRGLTTFLLLCDIKAAYASVSIKALCVVLERMGFPRHLCALLEAWGGARTAVLRVNGDASAPLPLRSGLGAGACHSPILWDLFIASLGRFLATLGAGLRVDADGNVSIFLFADDVACPEETFAALNAVALAVERWCTAWGLVLKVGPAKTAYLAIYPPARAAARAQPLPPLLLAAGEVPRVHEYKYLGLLLREDLSRKGLLERAAAKLAHLLAQFFSYNSVLSLCDAVSTSQIFKVNALAAISYLTALLPCTEAAMELLDKVLRRAARRFLGLPGSTPNEYVTAAAGLPSGRYMLLVARAQFYLSLAHTPYVTSPAARLLRATRGLPPSAAASRGIPPAWMAETKTLFKRVLAVGGPPPPAAATRADASRAAAAWARSACAAAARHAFAGRPPLPGGPLDSSARPPADPKPADAAAALAFGYAYPADLLGDLSATPMSFAGHRGAGAGLGLTTVRIPGVGTPGLALAALGAVALSRGTLGRLAPAWALPERSPAAAHAAAARGRACPACALGRAATPYHLACECDNPAVARERRALAGAARAFLPALVAAITRAARPFDARGTVATAALRLQLALQANEARQLSDFLVFRLLLVRPFHAGVVGDAAAQPREAGLGALFDATVLPNSALHRVYNLWASWAARRLTRLVRAWGAELGAAPGAAPAGAPPEH